MKKLNILFKSAALVAAVCLPFSAMGQESLVFVSNVARIDSLRVSAVVRPVDACAADSSSAGLRKKRNIVRSSAATLARIFPLSTDNTIRLTYNIKPSESFDLDRAFRVTKDYIDHMFNDGLPAGCMNNYKCVKTGYIDLMYKYPQDKTYICCCACVTMSVMIIQDMIYISMDMNDIMTYTQNRKSLLVPLVWTHNKKDIKNIMHRKSSVTTEQLVAYIKACDVMMKSVMRYINILNTEMN